MVLFGVHYRARFFGVDGIFLSKETYEGVTIFPYISSISHEVGHYLELNHTHDFNTAPIFWREPISRTRMLGNSLLCEKTGDLLSDTPADHELNSNNSCTYDITGLTDLWGDSYANPPVGASSPDPTNILSYNKLRSCRDFFSRQQIAVMLYSIERGKSNSNTVGWKDIKGEYDSYEPDNDATTARPILFREMQERNFHQQYTDEDFQGTAIWSNCDVDWIRYTPTCTATFFVETSAMINRAAANTRLTLFNATGVTQLAQNDNISGTNLFSKFSYSFVAGTTYLIRVENMSPGANVYYKISIVEMPIAGADNFCTSSVYSIPNLPSGASITWSASPSGRVSFSPNNASPTTITRLTDGAVTISANTAIAGCVIPVVSKQVYVGKPLVSGTYLFSGNQQPLKLWLGNAATDYNNACNLQTTTTSMQIYGATSGTWTRTAANPTNTNWSQNGNNLSFYLWSTGQTAVFRLQAGNACGTTTSNYGFKAISCGGGGGGGCESRYRVSPNPANGFASITVINIPPPCDIKTVTQAEQDALTIKTVRIYDNKGVIKKSAKVSAAKKYQLLLPDLKTGVYFIEISDGVYTEKQQLIITK